MQSKNKAKPTADEKEWIEAVKSLPCVVCNAPPPSDRHEFEQGLWFASSAPCRESHTGSKGYHGTRERLKNAKMDSPIKMINETFKAVVAANKGAT